MHLDPGFLLRGWPLVLGFCVLVVVVKFIGGAAAAAVFRRPLPGPIAV